MKKGLGHGAKVLERSGGILPPVGMIGARPPGPLKIGDNGGGYHGGVGFCFAVGSGEDVAGA